MFKGDVNTISAFSSTTIAISALFLLFFFKHLAKSKKATTTAELPPGPRGLPIIGYLPFVGTQLHKKFTELSKTFGPIYKLWLGNNLFVVISSPSLIKEVVRDQDLIFANRNPPIVARIVGYDGNDIAWSSYGSQWIKLRKVFVREMMSNNSLDSTYPMRKQEVRKSIYSLFCKAGCQVNVGDTAFLMNLNAVMSVLWGATLEGEEGINAGLEFRKLLSLLLEIASRPNISDILPVLARFDLQGLTRQSEIISKKFDAFLESAINHGLRKIRDEKDGAARQRKDFLRILLELNQKNDPETPLTMTEIKALLMDSVFGGTDTTSTAVEWTLSELLQNQQQLKKVQQELDEIVGRNEHVEEIHLPRLRYLDAVVKETLRLHPPLSLLLPHISSKSCIVGGYMIPEGTTVLLNVYAVHRDAKLWDSPLEFKPERFLNEDGTKHDFDFSGNNFQYAPFGSGRRICAGLPIVEKMLSYQLASLLHCFEWKLPDDEGRHDLRDVYGLVLRKSKPLVAIPTPRLSNADLYNLSPSP